MRTAILLTGLLLMAGCADPAATKSGPVSASSATPLTTAPAAMVDESTGSVTGVVVNSELAPISSVRVSLVEAKSEASTDAAGAFTFNGVAPGDYRIVFDALGYESVARKVSVAIAQVAFANATLAAIEVASEAYHVSIPRTSLITVDNGLISGGLKALVPVNTTVVTDAAFCNTCRYYLHVQQGATQILSEAVWSASSQPMVNQNIELWYWWAAGTVTGYGEWEFMVLGNRDAHTWSADNLAKANKKDVIVLDVTAEEMGFSVQHRVDTWTTFAYNAELPDEFTALPPA